MKLTMLGTGNALVTECYNTCFIKLNVKNLLLYHTEDKNLPDRSRLNKEEGTQYYHGNLFIPDDLECLELWV